MTWICSPCKKNNHPRCEGSRWMDDDKDFQICDCDACLRDLAMQDWPSAEEKKA